MVPKIEESQIDVEQSHVEDLRVETSTQVESSTDGRKSNKDADRLLHDARENVGAPTSQHRQRRSPEKYNGYMDLMSGCVLTKPSSFEEIV